MNTSSVFKSHILHIEKCVDFDFKMIDNNLETHPTYAKMELGWEYCPFEVGEGGVLLPVP